MTPQDLVNELKASKEFFDRSSRVLTEENSQFAPMPEMMTAAQLVSHVAQTIEWFLDGAFSPKGFDTDFEAHAKKFMAVKSLNQARQWLDRAYAAAMETIESKSEAELAKPIAPGPIMGNAARWHAVLGMVEHTAHHRGALTVYSRLLKKVPAMPYMEM